MYQQQIKQQHQQAFNFYQSRPINRILTNRKSEAVIHFRDYEFIDDDVEYLKRYYMANQSMVRLHKLISKTYIEDYYQDHMTPPSPNLIPFHTSILQNWKRRQVKLADKGQHSQTNAACKQDQHSSSHANQLLPLLENSHFSELDKSHLNQISYASSVHDIYQHTVMEESLERQANIFHSKLTKQFELVIDFKAVRHVEQASSRAANRNHHSLKLMQMPRNMADLAQEPAQQTVNQTSFMEYYSTVPKTTNPNRLLSKYIRSEMKRRQYRL